MNWKIIVGILLLFGALSELFSVISDYTSGKLQFWPFGLKLVFAALVILGILLITKAENKKKKCLIMSQMKANKHTNHTNGLQRI